MIETIKSNIIMHFQTFIMIYIPLSFQLKLGEKKKQADNQKLLKELKKYIR